MSYMSPKMQTNKFKVNLSTWHSVAKRQGFFHTFSKNGQCVVEWNSKECLWSPYLVCCISSVRFWLRRKFQKIKLWEGFTYEWTFQLLLLRFWLRSLAPLSFRTFRASFEIYALIQTFPKTSVECFVYFVRVLIYKSVHQVEKSNQKEKIWAPF